MTLCLATGALRRDPAWDGPLEQAVSARNDEARRLLPLYLESQFGGLLESIDQPVLRMPAATPLTVSSSVRSSRSSSSGLPASPPRCRARRSTCSTLIGSR